MKDKEYCIECQKEEHDCCSLEDNNCPCCNETKIELYSKNKS
jgi:hypothetical protein